jgi:hypothetical protein
MSDIEFDYFDTLNALIYSKNLICKVRLIEFKVYIVHIMKMEVEIFQEELSNRKIKFGCSVLRNINIFELKTLINTSNN